MKKKLALLVAFVMVFALVPAKAVLAESGIGASTMRVSFSDLNISDMSLDELNELLDTLLEMLDDDSISIGMLAEIEATLEAIAEAMGLDLDDFLIDIEALLYGLGLDAEELGLGYFDLVELEFALDDLIYESGLFISDLTDEDLMDLLLILLEDYLVDEEVNDEEDVNDDEDVNDEEEETPPLPEEPVAIDLTPIEEAPLTIVLRFEIDTVAWVRNGIPQEALDAAPFLDAAAGRTMVPLRAVSEGLGATVSWDRDTRTVSIIGGASPLNVVVDEELPAGMGTAVIVDGRTFVPLAFVADALGAGTSWDADARAVYVVYPRP